MVYCFCIWGGPHARKEYRSMDERLKFVSRLLEGEKMAPLCGEFGISRATGYKVCNRYGTHGLDGLTDRSRRPYRQADRLPFQAQRVRCSDVFSESLACQKPSGRMMGTRWPGENWTISPVSNVNHVTGKGPSLSSAKPAKRAHRAERIHDRPISPSRRKFLECAK